MEKGGFLVGIFSKLKDYNGELENVLDKKYFSSNIKNLLLSMLNSE